MATLLFPMTGTDWKKPSDAGLLPGNDWAKYRAAAAQYQLGFYRTVESSINAYSKYGVFGTSASEVPEPWTVAPDHRYSAWGVGGHGDMKGVKRGPADTGTSLVGYPIVAPHYAAMIMADYPAEAERFFLFLMESIGIFSPLNNVESLGIDAKGVLHWNSLKGSWNLGLQALGAARALAGKNYPPHSWYLKSPPLAKGYSLVMPK